MSTPDDTMTTVTVPEAVTIPGQLAAELSAYIQGNPCPNAPVAVALKLCGGLEIALQRAAGNGAATPSTTDDVLARARTVAAAAAEAERDLAAEKEKQRQAAT